MFQRSCRLLAPAFLMTLELLAEGPLAEGPREAPRPLAALVEPLLAEALEKDPVLASLRADVQALEARAARSSSPADPMASLTWRNDGYRPGGLGSAEDTGLEVMASQELPWPGKLRLRGEVARGEVARAALALKRRRLDVERELRVTVTDLLAARDRLALLEEERTTLREVEEVTRVRYAVGLVVQQDVLRAQAEVLGTEPMRHREEGRARVALAQLNRLLSRPPGTPFPATLTLEEAVSAAGLAAGSYRLEGFLARAEKVSPELAQGEVVVARSESAVRLARLARRPDLSATASHLFRGSLPPMWSLGVGVSVPLFSRRKQDQELAEAEAALTGERARLADLRRSLTATSDVALARLESALLELAPLQKAVIVQDRLAVESAVGSYRAGTVPFVAVLEALRNLYVARRDTLEALSRVLRYEADLWALDLSGAGGAPGNGAAAAMSAASSGAAATTNAASSGAAAAGM